MYMVRLEGSPLFRLLPENQTISFNKYCSRLELKTALSMKNIQISQPRKHVIFISVETTYLLAKTVNSVAEKF